MGEPRALPAATLPAHPRSGRARGRDKIRFRVRGLPFGGFFCAWRAGRAGPRQGAGPACAPGAHSDPPRPCDTLSRRTWPNRAGKRPRCLRAKAGRMSAGPGHPSRGGRWPLSSSKPQGLPPPGGMPACRGREGAAGMSPGAPGRALAPIDVPAPGRGGEQAGAAGAPDRPASVRTR